MAIAPSTVALYAARFEGNLRQMSRWRPLCVDHSSELPYGTELTIGRDETDYSGDVRDYTPDQTLSLIHI